MKKADLAQLSQSRSARQGESILVNQPQTSVHFSFYIFGTKVGRFVFFHINPSQVKWLTLVNLPHIVSLKFFLNLSG